MILRRRSRAVDVTQERVVKILPTNPPHRGETVYIGGSRYRVTRARVTWSGRDWALHDLRVTTYPV